MGDLARGASGPRRPAPAGQIALLALPGIDLRVLRVFAGQIPCIPMLALDPVTRVNRPIHEPRR
mgnify:CR=1 FL=1